MAAKKTCMNPEARRQAADSKNKPRETSANMKGADDPDYENITLTFRNQNQPKGSCSPPKSKAWARPSRDSAQAPHCLYTAVTSLYILLALISIIMLCWVLVNSSEMSQELLVLKRELWNVSISVRECQEERKQSWSHISQRLAEQLDPIKDGTKKLKTLPDGINQIKTQLQEILKMLPKMSNQQSTPPSK
ncbi:mast cell-expressed membrane protein 1 [Desmodus rotundus]|uniref:mast cell-expressed membrane protein 1 n=1 Tax=Desmodus rotundus TaxID=9430 RepID=UPI0023810DD7|nr:mast cell-expressed membrane protein 1 [Desmodus rotundus]